MIGPIRVAPNPGHHKTWMAKGITKLVPDMMAIRETVRLITN